MIDISLIGTGGMVPLHNRFLTSMAARLDGSMLLIDCGEGTQVTLKQLGWGFKNLDFICFTHFHADHISGLPGLLLTVGNSGRTDPLTLIGPKGLKNIATCLCVIAPLPFELKFIEISFTERKPVNIEVGSYNISAMPLNHRIMCIGYSIEVHRAGKFDAERAKQKNIPLKLWTRLQKGETVEQDGEIYTPDMVLGPARKGLKVSYITDTRPINTIPDFISGSDLFICEGLYGENDQMSKAAEHMHMTFSEAAILAQRGGVKELWLTHFSPALLDPKSYVDGVKNIFQNTKAGYDRKTKALTFEEEN